MPRTTVMRRLPALLGLLFAFGRAGSALEFGIETRAANMHFPWGVLAPTEGSAAYPSSNYFFGGAAWALLPIGEDAALRFSYEMDPVLRNIATGLVLFERGVTKIAVGPFAGFLNGTGTLLSAGLSTSVRFQWPGIAFVSVRSDGGLALGLLTQASEPQAQAELAAGIYVRNAIVSIIVNGKRFEQTDAAGYLVADSLSRYALVVDIFKKNVPYTLMTQAAYQIRSKYFAATEKTETIGSLILGARFSFQIGGGFTPTVEVSSSVFAFGSQALAGRSPDKNAIIFSAALGLSADTERILRDAESRKAEREALKKQKEEEKAAAEAAALALEADEAAKASAESAELPPATNSAP